MYNCKSKKITQILSSEAFEKIIQKTTHPNLYSPYQILWQDKKIITLRLDLNGS
jgi:hypothetical protein